jgi:hypothetical protein
MNDHWKLTILDAYVPALDLGSLTAGDIDGDGYAEIVTGGNGGLFWYRPATFEKGMIAQGNFSVGLLVDDMDEDGIREIYAAEKDETRNKWIISRFTICADKTFAKSVVDDNCSLLAHDLISVDIDGDGKKELLANAVFAEVNGIYIYKPEFGWEGLWQKYPVSEGIFTEGLSVGDLDGDGRMEIVSGPDWYKMPEEGAFSGPWIRRIYAPDFRELCLTRLFDISGNGRPDILITDSEYMDGYLSWFENRMLEDPENPWVEHRIEEGLVFSHSLDVTRDRDGIKIFAAEMEHGGFFAPYNHDARLILYTSKDQGGSWERQIICKGEGTHQAFLYDIDGDGDKEIVGKTYGHYYHNAKVMLWKNCGRELPVVKAVHSFIDRDKPGTATDMLAADVNGDGLRDILCGKWWYRNPDWERFEIPGVCQVIHAYDMDGDGKEEFIAVKKKPGSTGGYNELSSILCWVKPIDAEKGLWKEHPIGEGSGDWPHGLLVAPVLPNGRLALLIGYHNAAEGVFPELFEIPEHPEAVNEPWPKRVLAEIQYGEVMEACDIDGDGKLDIVAGAWWLENMGDGSFTAHVTAEGFEAARIAVMDITGNGRPDIIMSEHTMDFEKRLVPQSRVVWLENPRDPKKDQWTMHPIDTLRCVHSIGVEDIDGDGEPEIVCAEHDPFFNVRSQCKLTVYKKAEPKGRAWVSQTLDSRFEHHNGVRIFEVAPGKKAIASHGWTDNMYVHLWKIK